MSGHRSRLSQVRPRLIIRAVVLILGGLVFLTPVRAQPIPNQQSPAPVIIDTVQPIRPDPSLLTTPGDSLPPVRLLIPRLFVDLSVVEAPVVNGYWELSETSASHGVGSANPGDSGNIVVFAHARAGLFAPLRQVKVGDVIYTLTAVRWFSYKVDSITHVRPDQVEVIAPTATETLTLFTCSGFSDSQRLVVIAHPVL